MKPFIRGKILFSPDTPATRRIMGAVNATFSPIEGVRRYDVTNEMTIVCLVPFVRCDQILFVVRMTKKWIDVYSERVRGLFLDKENQEFMKVRTCL